MGPPNEEAGTDGSSIKPVSSLRARFENMSKQAPDTPSLPSPAPLAGRSVSPAAKPDRLRDPPTPTPNANRLSLTPTPKPKPAFPLLGHAPVPDSSSSSSSSSNPPLRPSNRLGPPPPLSPRPIAPPSLLVQPPLSPQIPLSPPKGKSSFPASAGADSSHFLNPDGARSISPSSSPRSFKNPSRPHSPNSVDNHRSPKLPPSQPPSPPPPRRSTELKRERDQREQAHGRSQSTFTEDYTRPLPPPVKRLDKPKISSQSQHIAHPAELVLSPEGRRVTDNRSPFSSPPSSSESLGDDQPPTLPTRPRPPVQHPERTSSMAPPPRPKAAAQVTFEPPPVRHTVATRRGERDQDATNSAAYTRRPLSPQPTGSGSSSSRGGTRPPLPTRPLSSIEPLSRSHTSVSARPPLTRPPRPSVDTANASQANSASQATPLLSAAAQKRVVSNPTATGQQFPPPPSRTRHGRSMTVDNRTGGKVLQELRTSNAALAAPQAAATTPTTPSTSAGFATPVDSVGSRSLAGSSNNNDYSASTPLATSSRAADLPSTAFPNISNINRRPPYVRDSVAEINTRYDSRLVDVCGQLVCTTGHFTRVWSLVDGDLLVSLAHNENTKATAIAFRPGLHVDDEGNRLWIGNNAGDLLEADIATQSIVTTKTLAHGRYEVIKIHRHFNEMWTLDESGGLLVWGPDDNGVPSLAGMQDQTFRVPRNHTFSIVVDDELWYATGKELRVFLPTVDGKGQFQVLPRALNLDGVGDICAGTTMTLDADKVFFGHTDGKVSIYSRKDYACLGVASVGAYKINTLASAGEFIWAGYSNGRVCVYETGQTMDVPWVVKKDWAAHDQPVVKLIANRSTAYRTGQLQMISLGADSTLRVWDGLLQEDWLEAEMQANGAAYCSFDKLRAHFMTWNAGASTPNSLRYSDGDASFMQSLLESSGSPDIMVFGFQELVDLEDKTATAKRFLKPKKKEADQERMSHQYRDWRDFLVRCLDDYMGGELYQLLQTVHMVGLFTCIFVKADLRDRIRSVGNTEVKRGMGGLHGNKGAVVVRFLVDDTSLCLVNCHLAAGQSQAAHRHNDIAGILESTTLPMERDATARLDHFVGGGDGTMVLDHELCVINGDLNYRIDTMSRDTVVAAVRANNLAKLLDRDQLLVARRRNAAFRLRAFEELPITFAPTYKYDVGTDNYDSSEKKRSPAWCDRLLFRGGPSGRVRQLDYRRHEVRVSDHRPVTGHFEFTVKRIDPQRRAVTWKECQQHWKDHRDRAVYGEQMYYLTQVIGYDEATSKGLIRSHAGRNQRSPSRHRE